MRVCSRDGRIVHGVCGVSREVGFVYASSGVWIRCVDEAWWFAHRKFSSITDLHDQKGRTYICYSGLYYSIDMEQVH